MARARVKVAAPVYPVPQTAAEADGTIWTIGLCQRERERIETAMNEELAAVKARYEAAAAPLKVQIEQLSKGLQTFCDANRAALTKDGKVKFHDFAAGRVQWRMRPPSVSVRKVEAVLAELKEMKLTRFIRVKEEPNKEAMLEEPDVARTVPGVSIVQGEDFVVTPFETKLEEVL